MTLNIAAKATQEIMKAKKWNILQSPNQTPDLSPVEHVFLVTEDKAERPMDLAKHLLGGNSEFGDIQGQQTLGRTHKYIELAILAANVAEIRSAVNAFRQINNMTI